MLKKLLKGWCDIKNILLLKVPQVTNMRVKTSERGMGRETFRIKEKCI